MISRERYLQYYFLFLRQFGKWFVTLNIVFWTLALGLSLFYMVFPDPRVHYGWKGIVTSSGAIVSLLWVRRVLARALDRQKALLREEVVP